jgi:phage-related protein
MSGVLPSVKGGHSVLAPFTKNISTGTVIARFENGYEQRFLDRGPMNTFVLQYKALAKADRDVLTAFFNTQKGSFDSSWTFYNRNPKIPDNGDFTLGLKNWSVTQDASQAFVQFVSNAYSRAGEAGAVTINKAITIPAHSTVSANFLSLNPFIYLYPGVLALDLWASLITNSSFPAAIQPRMQFGVFTTDATGNILGTVALGSEVTTVSGWHPVSGNLPPNPYPNASQGRVIVLLSLTNSTNTPVVVPFNCVAMLFSNVRIYAPGQTDAFVSCAFEDDTITWTENAQYPKQYDTMLRFRQVQVNGQGPAGDPLAQFPFFGPISAAVTGHPFVSSANNLVARNDLPTGNRIAYAFTGLAGFPGRALQTWTLTLPTLNDDETARLEQHFLGHNGSYRTFLFWDPDGKPYNWVRYASDTLEITHVQKGVHSVTLGLQEVFNPSWIP